ncbi:MAG: hypothetical protein HY286_07755 [Planctomycetes bacterium]|nr:hypothetical protein [Planctomycetota bacterium]
MKNRNLRTIFAAPILLFPTLFGGCLYSHVRHPLDLDLQETKLGSRRGEATAQSILWLVAWGDAGTAAAAQNGGITTLRHMDTEILFIFFGLFASETTIVYGD